MNRYQGCTVFCFNIEKCLRVKLSPVMAFEEFNPLLICDLNDVRSLIASKIVHFYVKRFEKSTTGTLSMDLGV